MKWTDEERDQALELYDTVGPSKASDQTGIPRATIGKWVSQRAEARQIAAARQVVQATEISGWDDENRAATIADLTVTVRGLVKQLQKTTSPHEISQLTGAIDKILRNLELLTGGATARTETAAINVNLDMEIEQMLAEMEKNAPLKPKPMLLPQELEERVRDNKPVVFRDVPKALSEPFGWGPGVSDDPEDDEEALRAAETAKKQSSTSTAATVAQAEWARTLELASDDWD